MVQKCRFCNAVNKGTGICSPYTFGKQPVAASYCKVFQCTFCTVVVYAEMSIFQIPSQIYFLIKRIQNGITNKGRLSHEYGSRSLTLAIRTRRGLQSQDVDVHVKNAALMHHERSDGSGYPAKLKGNQIDPYARMVAIADVYDAMTAARCYRGPLCPFCVIEMFETEGFQKYDVSILLPFLENVVNSCLQNRCLLNDGRKVTIIYINKEKLSRPVVQYGEEYINLADQPDLKIEKLL